MRLRIWTLAATMTLSLAFGDKVSAQPMPQQVPHVEPYIPPVRSAPIYPSPSLRPRVRSAPDKAFYQQALTPILRSVQSGRDLQWTSGARGGSVIFREIAGSHCRSFELHETGSGDRGTVLGQVCPAADTSSAYVITQIDYLVKDTFELERPRIEPLPLPERPLSSGGSYSSRDSRSPERPSPSTRPAPRVAMTPVIVEIDRAHQRDSANGGSAVVLFSNAPDVAARNDVVCREIWARMNTATAAEVRVGVRRDADGDVEALRPLYWLYDPPLTGAATHGGSRWANCAQRLAAYDYVRAGILRNKYGLRSDGPYFLVTRADEQAAAVIDLTGRSPADAAKLVRFFRDGFAFRGDVWDPGLAQEKRKHDLLADILGADFRDSLIDALGYVAAPAARAGCRLGDLNDAPCS